VELISAVRRSGPCAGRAGPGAQVRAGGRRRALAPRDGRSSDPRHGGARPRAANSSARARAKQVPAAGRNLVRTCPAEPSGPAASQEQTLEAIVPIEDCRLWSPEDPFLYKLEASTGADTVTTRFRHAQLPLDLETKQAVLNGKPISCAARTSASTGL